MSIVKALIIFTSITSLHNYDSFKPLQTYPKSDSLVHQLASTSITCFYRLTFKLDTVAKYPRTEYFRLLISGNKSGFQSTRQLLSDSIFAVYDAMPFTQEVANNMNDALSKAPQTEFSYEIYKDINNKTISYIDVIEPKTYLYTETINIFNWQINSDTHLINGYKCQQAKTIFRGRQYTAWFTRQIPISDGPYKFCGLPGLIVRIEDKNGDYRFDLVSLKQNKAELPIALPNKVINTTREKFLQAVKDFNNSFIERAIQNKVTFSNPELARKTFQEKLNRRNNPLELP